MKNIIVFTVFSIFLISCGNQQSKKQNIVQTETEVATLSVDELYKQVDVLTDHEVMVKGTVMHVCQHGGERCFIMGSNEDINIRIEAGEKIGAFGQELMGSEIEIIGVLREVKTEAEAHNPGEHKEGEHSEEQESDEAHKVIAESQEATEVVYFIEGLKSKEIKE